MQSPKTLGLEADKACLLEMSTPKVLGTEPNSERSRGRV